MSTLKSRLGAIMLPLLPINRRTFDILRYEWWAMRTRAINAINPKYHFQVRKLRGK